MSENKFVQISEITKPINKFRKTPISEEEYYMQEAIKLAGTPCPNCADTMCLFRGGLYIGCRSCLNYFAVDESGRLI
jgi:hypothetical protein